MHANETELAEPSWTTDVRVRGSLHRHESCDPVAIASQAGHTLAASTLRSIEERRKRDDDVRIPIARAYYGAVERPEMRPSWYTHAIRLRMVIAETSGSNNSLLCAIRAAAMTAFYGPTGLHGAWQRPVGGTSDMDKWLAGTPTDDAFERLPSLRATMDEAEQRLKTLLGVYAP